MLTKVLTGTVLGIDSNLVSVETDLSPGLPNLIIVGLPDATVKESKDRVRSAILNSGERFPAKRITINLSPASTRKEGTYFDLPMAIGILSASGVINNRNIKSFAYFGELSLDGSIHGIHGIVPLIIGVRKNGVQKIILPKANLKEAAIIKDVQLYPVESLRDVIDYFAGKRTLQSVQGIGMEKNTGSVDCEDFSDVAGQEMVKRALQISAAGCHGLLMIGPPGAGKTMMAQRVPSILPKMTYEETLELTKIYSVVGLLSDEAPMITGRPFRAPHHSISPVALVGGGRIPMPGEISLAHLGVLFLDELAEFQRNVIELLRQPLEEEKITISRARGTVVFPSKIMLIAAMNPCPCGFYGDNTHECTCTSHQISQYFSKVSGPFLDRIDMHIEILPVPYKDLTAEEPPRNISSSKNMRLQVESAREVQLKRYENMKIKYNSQLNASALKKFCKLDKGSQELLEEAFHKFALSARAYTKILRLSRTIADMDQSDNIRMEHVAEAIQYRGLDHFVRAAKL